MDFALLVPIVGQFVLRPVKTALATTKEELDAALASADQVTVEGDDELLSYAVNKASNDPENRVSVEVGHDSIYWEHRKEDVATEATTKPRLRGRRVRYLVLVLAGLLVLGLGGLLSLLSIQSGPAPPQPLQPTTPHSDFWANLPSLLWPVVAIVAIIALFLIARQAISSGSNVTIQWKVTEKVSGRVVITKVKERAPRSSKAA